MKDIIVTLFQEKPKHAVKIIVHNKDLWKWVLDNCDPNCIDNKTRIYTAITGEKILCPCGSGKLKSYITFTKGLAFCGRAGVCSAANAVVSKKCIDAAKTWDKKAAKNKRSATNLEKYGVENTGQLAKAIQARKELYDDPIRVKQITDNIKRTNIERYGVENTTCLPRVQAKRKKTSLEKYGVEFPTQSVLVQEKTKNTNLERYGVEYPINNPEIKKRVIATNRKKYNTDWTLAAKSIRETIEKTNMLKYGSRSPLGNEDIRKQNLLKIEEKYGQPYPSQNQSIQEKTRETNLLRYGIEFSSQSKYSDLAKDILFDINKFTTNLKELGVVDFSKKIGVCETTILNFHSLYNLNIITSNSSSYEAELSSWLSSIEIDYAPHNRTLCKPQEIDLYIPTHKLAIEVDGLYWHSELRGKDKNYHITKTRKCGEQGIQLIHIFEDEWLLKKNICKGILLSRLGKISIKVAARKCEIREISNYTAKKFLNENHLQGYVNASFNIALIYNDEIVSLMTFGKPRYNKTREWELLRLANKIGIQVQGGTQKLWKYFKITKSPNSVVSYCDRRWFTGEVYKNMNFIRNKESIPTYWYTDLLFRYHRSKYTKQKCVSLAMKNTNLQFTKDQLMQLTENQITKDILGLDRIWDCGQDSWFWTK